MATTGKQTPRLTVSMPDEGSLRAVLTVDDEQVLVTIVQLKALSATVEALVGSKPTTADLAQLFGVILKSAEPSNVRLV